MTVALQMAALKHSGCSGGAPQDALGRRLMRPDKCFVLPGRMHDQEEQNPCWRPADQGQLCTITTIDGAPLAMAVSTINLLVTATLPLSAVPVAASLVRRHAESLSHSKQPRMHRAITRLCSVRPRVRWRILHREVPTRKIATMLDGGRCGRCGCSRVHEIFSRVFYTEPF
jgi:hypothetical protein